METYMIEDPWLSIVMQTNCYNVTCNTIEDYSEHRKPLLNKETFFTTVRTQVSPDDRLLKLDKTILFVSTMNSYSWTPSDVYSNISNSNVNLYREDNFQDVINIANGAFTSDRFHNDPRISKTFADKIKLSWLKANLSQNRETVTLIYTSPNNKNILGFNSVVVKENSIAIDLISVSSEFRRLGVATELINASKKLALDRGLSLTVGTQKSNAANDLYLKNGFVLKESVFISHDTNTTFQ